MGHPSQAAIMAGWTQDVTMGRQGQAAQLLNYQRIAGITPGPASQPGPSATWTLPGGVQYNAFLSDLKAAIIAGFSARQPTQVMVTVRDIVNGTNVRTVYGGMQVE